jgi:hypothetical protein
MKTPLEWQLYVCAYTLVLGICCLLFPNPVITLFGYPPTDQPWIRILGMMTLGFCYLSWSVYRYRMLQMIRISVTIRSAFVAVFVLLGLTGFGAWMFAFAAIVAVGVAGSLFSYRRCGGWA